MRIRFRFTKLGKIRFTSQRDVARMWERALRRASLPVAYSEGFSPRPLLSFGLALPTGCESLAEYVDVVLDPERAASQGVDALALVDVMGALMPEGIDVVDAVVVERHTGSLQQFVTSCSWIMHFGGVTPAELAQLAEATMAASEVQIVRERKGRQEMDDLRPSILTLEVPSDVEEQSQGGAAVLHAELATQPRGVRPVELVRALIAVAGGSSDGSSQRWAVLGGAPVGVPVLDRACRTQQWIERDGAKGEPLARRIVPSDDTRQTTALERTS